MDPDFVHEWREGVHNRLVKKIEFTGISNQKYVLATLVDESSYQGSFVEKKGNF